MSVTVAQTPATGGTAAAATSVTTGAGATGAANLGSTPTAGNGLFIAVEISDNATTITTPAGYTLLGAILREGSASLAVYYKVAGAGEPTSATVNFGSAANATIIYWETAGSHQTLASTIEAAVTNTAFSTSTATSVTGAGATTDGTEMVVCLVGALGKPTHSTPLDSATIQAQVQSTGGSGTTGSSLALMTKTLSANETPTVGDTLSVSRNWGAIVFAIKAQPVGTPVSNTLALPVDSQAGIAAAPAAPVETNGAVAATLQNPYETSQPASTFALFPVDAQQGITGQTATPVDAPGAARSTPTLPVDAAANLAVALVVAVESQTATLRTAGLPFETLTAVSTAVALPVDAVGINTIPAVARLRCLSSPSVMARVFSQSAATAGARSQPAVRLRP